MTGAAEPLRTFPQSAERLHWQYQVAMLEHALSHCRVYCDECFKFECRHRRHAFDAADLRETERWVRVEMAIERALAHAEEMAA